MIILVMRYADCLSGKVAECGRRQEVSTIRTRRPTDTGRLSDGYQISSV